MVNLTRIYTRTGDAGSTRLGDMSETTKTDLRLRAYADVDETNAHLGVVLATGEVEPEVAAVLEMPAGAPVLIMERRTLDAGGRMVERRTSWLNTARHRYVSVME